MTHRSLHTLSKGRRYVVVVVIVRSETQIATLVVVKAKEKTVGVGCVRVTDILTVLDGENLLT